MLTLILSSLDVQMEVHKMLLLQFGLILVVQIKQAKGNKTTIRPNI
jgi:hypothetical protein